MAQSHPSERQIEQAENSIRRAETAVNQAAKGEEPAPPVQMTQSNLQEDRNALNELKR